MDAESRSGPNPLSTHIIGSVVFIKASRKFLDGGQIDLTPGALIFAFQMIFLFTECINLFFTSNWISIRSDSEASNSDDDPSYHDQSGTENAFAI